MYGLYLYFCFVLFCYRKISKRQPTYLHLHTASLSHQLFHTNAEVLQFSPRELPNPVDAEQDSNQPFSRSHAEGLHPAPRLGSQTITLEPNRLLRPTPSYCDDPKSETCQRPFSESQLFPGSLVRHTNTLQYTRVVLAKCFCWSAVGGRFHSC